VGIILSRKHLLNTRPAKLGLLSLFLIPIAIFAITTANNQSADAAVSATFPDQTVNIEQGTTEVTLAFTANVDSTTYTDGYDIATQIDPANSTIPSDVSIANAANLINDTTGTVVREYRKATNPTDDG
jgi:hypothetical protein